MMMFNKAMFAMVVFIWSTTPLAMKWGTETLSFIGSISLRMGIALLLSLALMLLLKKPLPMHKRAWICYATGALGMYPSMTLVYFSVQYVPSGLISVVFGMTPFIVGIFSTLILKEKFFTLIKTTTLLLALLGLAIVFSGQLNVDANVLKGFPALLTSITFFGLSTVLIKKVNADLEPLQHSAGSILLSMPFYLITWIIIGFDDLTLVSTKSWSAIAYLSVIGSIIGFIAFFYLLKHLKASTVSLVSLLSPVMAVMLGKLLADEIISSTVLFGASLILVSLAISQQENRILYFLKSNTADTDQNIQKD